MDAQFGGTDQRKIFTYAEKYLPQLGYKKRAHLMNFMVPGLMGSKMSSSDPDSKIDLLDDAKTIQRKIKKAFCEEGNIAENGLLSFAKFVLFPLYALRASHAGNAGRVEFLVKRKPEFGGDLAFANYQQLEDVFAAKQLHPGDLKNSMADAINEFLEPIRERWAKDPELQKLTDQAYPATVSAPKPVKGGGANGAANAGATKNTKEDISRFDLRVGQIKSVRRHPDADSLYVEEVDLGEEKLRTVVSGLVKYFPAEQLENRMVVLMCNLKPSKLRGILSEAMVMAASNADGTVVELLDPPVGSAIGDKVTVQGYDGQPDAVLNPKQKFYADVLAELKTADDAVATYKGIAFQTPHGQVKVKSLKEATIR